MGHMVTRYKVDGETVNIETPDGNKHQIVYRPGGFVERCHPGAQQELSNYDEQGRCTARLQWTYGERTPQLWSKYKLSASGDLQAVEEIHQKHTRYRYDRAHRVVEAGDPQCVYEYDAGGNLTKNYRYEKLTYDARHMLMSADNERFTYIDRFELATWERDGVVQRFYYNSLGRLVKITWDDGRPEWTAAYDGLGRRIWKQYGDARTEYYWEGSRLAAEHRVDKCFRLFVYPNREALVPLGFLDSGNPDMRAGAGHWFRVHCNHVGMAQEIRDWQGELAWKLWTQDPFGEVLTAVDFRQLEWSLRWPGHIYDPERGLHYNRFRYYSLRLGRYLRVDPLGQAGGINVYAYPGNPLASVDLFGLSKSPCGKGKGGGEGGEERWL